jgi:hypothetical protein
VKTLPTVHRIWCVEEEEEDKEEDKEEKEETHDVRVSGPKDQRTPALQSTWASTWVRRTGRAGGVRR